MSGRVRWGILGAGRIAAQFAADLRLSRTGTLGAVASRDPARADALARPHGAGAARDYDALVSDPRVDAVYVATPNALHRAHCLLAIRAGKAVLCEKPMGTSAADVAAVAEAARAAGVLCVEGMWTLFLPAMRAALGRIEAGALGPVTQLRATLGFATHEDDPVADPALGGGALWDLGAYGAALAHAVLGSPTEVRAVLAHARSGAVREVAAVMRHADGPRAPISILSISHGARLSNTLEVAGPGGLLVIDAPFVAAPGGRLRRFAPPAARGDGRKGRAAALRAAVLTSPLTRGAARRLAAMRGAQALQGHGRGYGLHYEIDEVGRCLAAGLTESAILPLDRSIAAARTLEAIRDAGAGLSPP